MTRAPTLAATMVVVTLGGVAIAASQDMPREYREVHNHFFGDVPRMSVIFTAAF